METQRGQQQIALVAFIWIYNLNIVRISTNNLTCSKFYWLEAMCRNWQADKTIYAYTELTVYYLVLINNLVKESKMAMSNTATVAETVSTAVVTNMPKPARMTKAEEEAKKEAFQKERAMFIANMADVFNTGAETRAKGLIEQYKALRGLANYICGNQDLRAATEFAEKLPAKARKGALDIIAVLLGHYDNLQTNLKTGKSSVERRFPPLFTMAKGIISVSDDTLLSTNKATRNAAYKKLCKNRLPDSVKLENLTIKNPPAEDKAGEILERLQGIAKNTLEKNADWKKTTSAKKLIALIKAMSAEIEELDKDTISSLEKQII